MQATNTIEYGAKFMTKIEWTTSDYIPVGDAFVSISRDLKAGFNSGGGLKKYSVLSHFWRKLIWPCKNLHDELFVDGFIERDIARLFEKYSKPGDSVLDIACGSMGMKKYFSSGSIYNGLDFRLSEFHVRNVLEADPKANLIIASATDIPALQDSADIILCIEALPHIHNVEKSLFEIRRVGKKGAKLICSMQNGYCTKYQRKGPNPYTVSDWTYDEFVDLAGRHGLKLIEGYKKGWWIPLTGWTKLPSYSLPLSRKDEKLNTNFFFVFEIT